MDDGLVALLTELTYAKPDWNEIAKRTAGQKYELQMFEGVASKYALRIMIEAFIQKSKGWAEPLNLPELSYGVPEDADSQITFFSRDRTRPIVGYDSMLRVNKRPVAVDIKIARWQNVTNGYFREQELAKNTVLEDLFGVNNFDRVLIVPNSERKAYHGVNVVRPSFSLAEYRLDAEVTAGKHGLLKE